MKLRRHVRKAPGILGLGIAAHVVLWIVFGLAVVAGTLFLFWISFDRPHLQSQAAKGIGPAALFNAAKLALAVVAGIGGVVALVVAFRRQRLGEADHERQDRATSRDETRLFTERFAQATEQLGSDHAAVRVAGVYALAGLADDWPEGRQTCVDVLCAYVRMPFQLRSPLPKYESDNEHPMQRISSLRTDMETPTGGRMAYPASEEYQVRSAILRAMRGRMTGNAPEWSDLTFDFTGAIFDEASFDGFVFDGCTVRFGDCVFVGETSFAQSRIVGSHLWFTGAIFLGRIIFDFAHLEASEVTLFSHFGYRCDLTFQECTMKSGAIDIHGTWMEKGDVNFVSSSLEGGVVTFTLPQMNDGNSIAFTRSTISGTSVVMNYGSFDGGDIWFNGVTLKGGLIAFSPRNPKGKSSSMNLAGTKFSFNRMDLQDGSIMFRSLEIDGSLIRFDHLKMIGGAIQFIDVALKSGDVRMDEADVEGGSIDLGGMAETTAGQAITSAFGEFVRPVVFVADH